jgi:hypothetical protein
LPAAERLRETEDKLASDANRKQRREANAEFKNDLLADVLFGFVARLIVMIDHSSPFRDGVGDEYAYGRI